MYSVSKSTYCAAVWYETTCYKEVNYINQTSRQKQIDLQVSQNYQKLYELEIGNVRTNLSNTET